MLSNVSDFNPTKNRINSPKVIKKDPNDLIVLAKAILTVFIAGCLESTLIT